MLPPSFIFPDMWPDARLLVRFVGACRYLPAIT